MFLNYKIYYNDSFVLLTNQHPQSNKNFAKVLDGEKECVFFFKNSLQLFDANTNGNILAISNNPLDVLKKIINDNTLIVAGGGIVSNEQDDLLLIYRRGKWDLAKGKIEPNEKIIDGAVREVEEETGVKIKKVNKKPLLTYHAYQLKGKSCIKETSWYEMKAKDGQKTPTPQTEEGIDEVRWVKKQDLKNYQEDSYLLVWDLLVQNGALLPNHLADNL